MLIREVAFVENWKKYLAGELPRGGRNPPVWAVASFIPKEGEDGAISMYEIDTVVEPTDVAAALRFTQSNKASCFFVGVERETLEKNGFKIEPTNGSTRHPEVNGCHFDVKIETASMLRRITLLFLKGKPEPVEYKRLDQRLTAHARVNRIDWMKTAKEGPETAWKRVQGFTKEKAIALSGQPLTGTPDS